MKNSNQRYFHVRDLDKDLETTDSKLIEKINEVISGKGKMEIKISDNFADIQVFPPDGVFESQIISYDHQKMVEVEKMVENFSHFGNKAIKQASEFFGHEVRYPFLKDIFKLAADIKENETYDDFVLDAGLNKKDLSAFKRLREAIKRLYIKSQKLSLVSEDNSKKILVDPDKLISSDLAVFNEELLMQLSESLLKLGSLAFQIKDLTRDQIDPYSVYDEESNMFGKSLDEKNTKKLEQIVMVRTENQAENEFLESAEKLIPLLTKLIKSSPQNYPESKLKSFFGELFTYKKIAWSSSVPDDLNPYFFQRWKAFFKRKAQKT